MLSNWWIQRSLILTPITCISHYRKGLCGQNTFLNIVYSNMQDISRNFGSAYWPLHPKSPTEEKSRSLLPRGSIFTICLEFCVNSLKLFRLYIKLDFHIMSLFTYLLFHVYSFSHSAESFTMFKQ